MSWLAVLGVSLCLTVTKPDGFGRQRLSGPRLRCPVGLRGGWAPRGASPGLAVLSPAPVVAGCPGQPQDTSSESHTVIHPPAGQPRLAVVAEAGFRERRRRWGLDWEACGRFSCILSATS